MTIVSTTVIVSAFFKIPSKKPYSFYREYLHRWFRSIRAPTVFFTSEDVYDDILSMGYHLENVQFQIMTVNDFKAWNLGRDFWERQQERDIEKYHTPELAAIWYEKKEFVKRAFSIIEADVYIWCDAGCVRDDVSEVAFTEFGLRSINLINNDKIHLQHIRFQPYKSYYVYPEYRYAGAIIAGNRQAWIEFDRLYYNVIKEYDENGISCNSDQYIMASCYDKTPHLFVEHTPTNLIVNPWFFFLGLL